MMRTTIPVVVLAVAVAACSKDRSEPTEQRVAEKVVESEPGVAVVSANELGPQHRRQVTITTRSDDARTAFERGRQLQENVRPYEAMAEFRRAIDMDPEFALAHAYLSVTSEDRKEKSEHMDKALALAGDLPEAEQLLIQGLAARNRGDVAGELKVYEELRTIASNDYRVAMWLGMTARRHGDLKGAIEALERAIELDPRAAEPYNDLAYTHMAAGDFDKAVESAQTYARLRPQEPNPQDSLGEILLTAGRFEEAEAAFRKALDIQPSFLVSFEGMALAQAYRQRWDAAVELMRKAVAEEPAPAMKVRYLEDVIWLELAAGKQKAALATLDELEDLVDRRCRDCLKQGSLLRAGVLHAIGDYKAARKQLARRIAELDEANPKQAGDRFWAVVALAWACVEADDLPAARKALAQLEAIARNGDAKRFEAGLTFVRGTIALAGGDEAAAIEALSGLSEAAPYYAQARWQLAAALERDGANEKARAVRASLLGEYRRSFRRAYDWQHYTKASGS